MAGFGVCVMNSENEFELKGNTYVAVVDEFYIYECAKCAFEFIDCTIGVPNCYSGNREDGKPVYFKGKQ
jgi:hypothetical protein